MYVCRHVYVFTYVFRYVFSHATVALICKCDMMAIFVVVCISNKLTSGDCSLLCSALLIALSRRIQGILNILLTFQRCVLCPLSNWLPQRKQKHSKSSTLTTQLKAVNENDCRTELNVSRSTTRHGYSYTLQSHGGRWECLVYREFT